MKEITRAINILLNTATEVFLILPEKPEIGSSLRRAGEIWAREIFSACMEENAKILPDIEVLKHIKQAIKSLNTTDNMHFVSTLEKVHNIYAIVFSN